MMFKNLRKWLAIRLYPLDPSEIIKDRLGPLERDLSNPFNGLSTEDQQRLLSTAHSVRTAFAFDHVLNSLQFVQIDYAAKEAPSWDAVLFARATINGIELVREEFNRLSSLYLESQKAAEKFDKSAIV